MIMESFVTERRGVSAMGLGGFIDTLDCRYSTHINLIAGNASMLIRNPG